VRNAKISTANSKVQTLNSSSRNVKAFCVLCWSRGPPDFIIWR